MLKRSCQVLVGAALLASCSEGGAERITAPPVEPPPIAEVANHLAGVADRFSAQARNEEAVAAIRLAGGIDLGHAIHDTEDPAEVLCISEFSHGSTLFPQHQLARTYEWEPGLGSYAVSGTPGAPECGFRLVYYRLDAATGEPALPLEPLGYIQFVDDESAVYAGGNQTGLQVEVVGTTGGEPRTFTSYTKKASNAYYTGGSSHSESFDGWFDQGEGEPLHADWTYQSGYRRQGPAPGATDEWQFVQGRESVEISDQLVVETPEMEVTIASSGDISVSTPDSVYGIVAHCTCWRDPVVFTDTEGSPLEPPADSAFRHLITAASSRFGRDAWP